jgi:iduronate 2-sulfatase
MDGADLSPVLHDPAARVRGYSYHAYHRPNRIGQAIRTERYRLVRWTQEQTGARDYELYDLVADPLETRNVSAERAEVKAELDAILDSQPKPKSVNLRQRRTPGGGRGATDN